MLNCNNNDQILFEREVSNNSIKLNCVTELLIHRIPSNHIFQSGLYLLRAVYSYCWSIETPVTSIHDLSNPILSHFFKVSYTCFEQYILADQSGPESHLIFFESELSHLSYVSPLFFDALWVPPQCAKLIAAVMPRAQP